jgi:hypothetical protein
MLTMGFPVNERAEGLAHFGLRPVAASRIGPAKDLCAAA